MKTSKGEIVLRLYFKRAPLTVSNFVGLAEGSKDWKDPVTGKAKKTRFFDGLNFHRVIKDFMIQGGCPTGDGTGGPGYRFNDEPVTRQYTKGTLAMANAGPNTNGSQFFIVHGANAGLPPNYTIFGMVSSGAEVLDALANVEVTSGGSGERSTPVATQVIEGIDITES